MQRCLLLSCLLVLQCWPLPLAPLLPPAAAAQPVGALPDPQPGSAWPVGTYLMSLLCSLPSCCARWGNLINTMVLVILMAAAGQYNPPYK